MRILLWLPLATIIGLSFSLAILLARPVAPTIILTIVTPAAAPAPVLHFAPTWNWPYAYAPCNAWSRICP